MSRPNEQVMWGRVSRRLFLAAMFAFLVLVFAPLFFWLVEHDRSGDVHSVGDAYGWLFRTLFENTSPYKLKNQFGYFSYWIVRVAGVSLVAFATATVASRFVATVINRGAGMGNFKGSGHLMICGWSPKGFEIIRELRAKEVEDRREIVILADIETAPIESRGTTFSRGNPSNTDDLQRAGIMAASTVIVLADDANSSNDPDDLDARSLLTTLAVESLNHDAYSCVEVVKSENRQHFERTRANELVVSAELTGSLLAASAVTHGLTGVVADLLTHPEGEEFYRVPVPLELVGRTARDALVALKDGADSTLVGIFADGTCTVNPPGAQVIAGTDELLVVRSRPAGVNA
ncbi:MAG: NAD-binding protein [Acidimicrobiia bacterium]|nr:NAD-binding protein [Acidimicrobiia bacterium]